MLPRRLLTCPLAGALFTAAFGLPAAAQKVGQSVMAIEHGAAVKDGKRIVARVRAGELLKIQKVDRDSYRVQSLTNGRSGWIDAKAVMTLDEAIAGFTRAIAERPTASRYVLRGMAYLASGKLDLALADYDQAVRLAPDDFLVYTHRATAWLRKKNYDKAIADYNHAIRLGAKSHVDYMNRGNAWLAKRDYVKAIADYDEAIRLAPEYSVPRMNRGIANRRRRELDKAIADFDDAIRLDHRSAPACFARAEAWIDKNDYDKAIADFDQAIRIEPNYRGALNYRAWLFATCPDPKFRNAKAAVRDATKACELSKWDDAKDLDTLAAAYAEAGDFTAAVKWQTKAVELCPKAERASKQARLALYKAGKPYRDARRK